MQIYLWAILAVAAWAVTGFGAAELIKYQRYDAEWSGTANNMRVIASQLSANAAGAAQGRAYSFEQLAHNRETVDRYIGELENGSTSSGVPGAPKELLVLLNNVRPVWQEITGHIESIANAQKDLSGRDAAFRELRDSTGPKLVASSQAITQHMRAKGYQPAAIEISQGQDALAAKMMAKIAEISKPGADMETLALAVTEQLSQYRATLTRLLAVQDPELQAKANENRAQFTKFNDQALMLLANDNAKVAAAASAIDEKVPSLDANIRQLSDAVKTLASTRIVQPTMLLIGAVVGLLFFAMMFVSVLGISSAQTEDARSVAERVNRQKALVEDEIRQTVNEIEPVANGDLTIRATETRPNTAMFAKAVNRITTALAGIVEHIRTSAQNINISAEETKQTTENIVSNSQELSREIQRSSGLATKLDKRADQVATRARDAAEQANNSVALVSKGQSAVRATNQSIESIRAGNKDTIHMIKNLLEKMQGVTTVLDEVAAVADMSNMLAINTGVMAQTVEGPVGRMMGNTAEEIQTLADRSRAATKAAGAIVSQLMSMAEETTRRTESSTQDIHRAYENSTSAMTAFDEITEAAKAVQSAAMKIAADMEDTKRDAGDVAESFKTADAISRQNHMAAEETKKAMESLTKSTRSLTEQAKVFKVTKTDQ